MEKKQPGAIKTVVRVETNNNKPPAPDCFANVVNSSGISKTGAPSPRKPEISGGRALPGLRWQHQSGPSWPGPLPVLQGALEDGGGGRPRTHGGELS